MAPRVARDSHTSFHVMASSPSPSSGLAAPGLRSASDCARRRARSSWSTVVTGSRTIHDALGCSPSPLGDMPSSAFQKASACG